MSGIPYRRLQYDLTNQHRTDRFFEAKNQLDALIATNLNILDYAFLTLQQLQSLCNTLVNEGVALIIIDMLELLESSSIAYPLQDSLKYSIRFLKSLAKELNVPILITAQHPASASQRQDIRPRLQDISTYNHIDQFADIVMFLYRDEYYNPDRTERPNIAEVMVAKHHNGSLGIADLYWHPQLMTYRNLTKVEIKL